MSSFHLSTGYFSDEVNFEPLSIKEAQRRLPDLIIPDLEQSLKKFLISIQPYTTHHEFNAIKSIVDRFLSSSNGIGPVVQEELEKRKQRLSGVTSWLSEWWNKMAYLTYREPTVINVSYFYQFKIPSIDFTLSERAASYVLLSFQYRKMIKDDFLLPEFLPSKNGSGTQLCAASYKYLFNTCRYPAFPDQDGIRMYDLEENSFITIVCRNLFFSLNLVNQETGSLIPFSTLVRQIDEIQRISEVMVEENGEAPCVGRLCCQNRDVWFEDRILLENEHEMNATSLRTIESSILLLCLDVDSTNNDCTTMNSGDMNSRIQSLNDRRNGKEDEIATIFLHNFGQNRYCDKTINLVVGSFQKQHYCGLAMEHSMMDGMPVIRYAGFLTDPENHSKLFEQSNGLLIEAPFYEDDQTAHFSIHHLPFCFNKSKLTAPSSSEISLLLTSPLEISYERAVRKTDELFLTHQTSFLHFPSFGSNFIKSHLKMSPDGLFQMCIQLASYRVHGHVKTIYEPVQMRRFLHGRTETARGVTNESIAWFSTLFF